MKKKLRKMVLSAAAVFGGYLLIILIFSVLFMTGSDEEKNALAASADDPARIAELMQYKAFGVPSDIVMMVTTTQCKTAQEALEKPFIYNALEFMYMTEIVKELRHTCDDDDDDDDCNCDYKTTAINTYSHKTAILSYIGVSEEPVTDLNGGNIQTKAQEAADAKCAASDADDIRIIQFNAIGIEDFEDAIKRCGVKKKKDIQGIILLHENGYFVAWLEGHAAEYGIDFGSGSTMTGSNGTHAYIVSMTIDDDTPFAGGGFTSPIPYDWRQFVSCEFGTGYVGHTGMDLAVGMGTPVQAVADGKVLYVSRASGDYNGGYNAYGIHVVINHGGGIVTLYAHNSSALVSGGQEVTQGQVIAMSGNTGNSTGPHLHHEFIINGVPKNPRLYLS